MPASRPPPTPAWRCCAGEFVGFLDHDDTLTPDALLRVVQALEADPGSTSSTPTRTSSTAAACAPIPFLKPDWSPVYALGAMYIGHLLVVRRELAEAVGGFDPAFDKIQDFEFLLRVSERTDRIHHIPQITYHWRAIPGSIAAGAEEKSGVPELQARAVTSHLDADRRRSGGQAAPADPPPRRPRAARRGRTAAGRHRRRRVTRRRPAATAARLACRRRRERDRETIVVGAAPPEGAAEPSRGGRVDAGPGPFNRARANNAGAGRAAGDYLLFLDETAELRRPRTPSSSSCSTAALPGVGAVGPMLVRAGDGVEAAGVAIGLDPPAMPLSPGIPADGDGYYGSLPCAHEVSAVTADCMLVERGAFDAVGGFNEFYANGYEDFDLCQRLAAAGLSTVYTPRPRVLTHRPPAEGKEEDMVDRALFVDCWYDELVEGDPYFNPGFGRRARRLHAGQMAPPRAARGEERRVRLLIVYFGQFDVNSAIQAFHFGNELTEMGWQVTMTGRGNPARISAVGEADFECISHDDLDAKLRAWRAGPAGDRDPRLDAAGAGAAADEKAVAELGAPYVIHLEDNERYLLESAIGRPLAELQRLPRAEQDALTHPDLGIHPTNHVEFLRGAAAVTVITEELNEFNVAERPHQVVRPGIDSERFRPDLEPPTSRRELGLAEDDFVLVYHGTIHYANQHEMLSLYLAVKLAQRRGHPVRLVRLGHSEFGGPDPQAFRAVAEDVVELGSVPWREIPNYLALADAYVQPGPPDDFNRYRLPSKLPEFLAMGRPVILPHCNIGNDLTHGENALLLEKGNAMEITVRIEELLADPELAARLGRGSRKFALERLSWRDNAAGLDRLLRDAIRNAAAGAPA